MKIEITRSGGFAGLTRTWTLEVSRTEAEQRWLPLAAEADAAVEGSGPDAAPRQQRDRFTYRIAIGYTEVHLAESALDDPWRELIERARAATPVHPPVDRERAGTTQDPGVAGPAATAPDPTDPVGDRRMAPEVGSENGGTKGRSTAGDAPTS